MTSTSTIGGPRLSNVAARTARPFWRLHYSRRIQAVGVAFVLPTILFFLVFKYGPMVWAVELSFTSYDMVSVPRWTALENYRSLAVDPIFRESLWVTAVYIAGSTILITLVGLGLALAINTAVPGARYCMARCSSPISCR
jgi:multiple sugar transport system permease protein